MIQAKDTSIILNNLVKSYYNLQKNIDISTGNSEMCMGSFAFPRLSGEIAVGYGFALIDESNIFDLKVSGGVLQKVSYLNNIINIYNSIQITEININLGSDSKSNCHIYGTIYLGYDDNLSNASVSASLGQINNQLVFFNNDSSIDSIKEYMYDNNFIGGYIVNNSLNYKELYRFVIIINDYEPSASNPSDCLIYSRDMRQIKGWGGFSEETASVTLTTSSINSVDSTKSTLLLLKNKIKDVVGAWVLLSAWTPSFEIYWNQLGNTLPMPLGKFLLEELGVR